MMAQLGGVRKKLKVSLEFFGAFPPVRPQIITPISYLICSAPSLHFKYKLSSQTFGIRISIYAWYCRINELNENCLFFE